MTRFAGRSAGSGYAGLSPASTSARIVDTARLRNQLRSAGLPVREAVMRGAELRVRPVVMTSLTAALGLLPLLTAFIVVGTSLARALKIQPPHRGRPAGAQRSR